MISPRGLALIKEFEGLRLEAYQDLRGIWTIGYGHTDGVKPGDVWTEARAQMELIRTLNALEARVYKIVRIPLGPNKMAALISFAYNLGMNSLLHSTLLKLLNKGQIQAASDEFSKWNRVANIPTIGLLRRRMAERDLFLS